MFTLCGNCSLVDILCLLLLLVFAGFGCYDLLFGVCVSCFVGLNLVLGWDCDFMFSLAIVCFWF